MAAMSETQVRDQVVVRLDEKELRTLLDHWIETEIGMEMSQYHSRDCGTWQANLRLHAGARQAALMAVVNPTDVALVQRNVRVRLWRKALEWPGSVPQPLDPDTVRRIHRENEKRDYSDPRGYFSGLVPVLFPAVAAQIQHDLSASCDCGPEVTAGDGTFGGEELANPLHRSEHVASRRAADAALGALAKWHSHPGISE